MLLFTLDGLLGTPYALIERVELRAASLTQGIGLCVSCLAGKLLQANAELGRAFPGFGDRLERRIAPHHQRLPGVQPAAKSALPGLEVARVTECG